MWGHVICPGQSEVSIPANQRPDTIKYVTGRRHEELTEENCAVFKKRVLIELLFLSKQNFAHHIFCNLNKCSRVYKDFAQIGARHEEQEPRLQETRMRSNCAQRLVRPALFCSYRTAAPFPWYGLKTKAAIFVRGSQSNMSQEAGRHQKEWQEQSPRCINTRVFIKLLSLPTQFSDSVFSDG